MSPSPSLPSAGTTRSTRLGPLVRSVAPSMFGVKCNSHLLWLCARTIRTIRGLRHCQAYQITDSDASLPFPSTVSFLFFLYVFLFDDVVDGFCRLCVLCPVSCVIPGVPFCCCCCDSNIIYTFTRSLLSRIYQSNWNLFVVALLSHTNSSSFFCYFSFFGPLSLCNNWKNLTTL